MDALILAGGKSSRMEGRHKGNLLLGDETFTQILINELQKVTDKVWISYGSTLQGEHENCGMVRDIFTDCGPIGGIHAGLSACETEAMFVVACDMPFMKAEFVEELGQYLQDGVDGVVPVSDGRIHPLAAIYRKNVLSSVENQILIGNYRLRDILEQLEIRFVDISSDKKLKEMLRNINTMKEYEAL